MRHLAVLSLLATVAAANADLLAVRFDGSVIMVHETTAAVTNVGPGNHSGLNNLANSFNLQCLTAAGSTLYSLNPTTGVSTPVSTLTFAGADDIRAMARDANGTLWAVVDHLPFDQLFVVNVTSGTGSLIGDTGSDSVQSLECDPFGRLFTYDRDGRGLGRLSRLDGHFWDINPAAGVTNNIQTLCFTQDGRLFGGNQTLVQLDPVTAVETVIGSGLGDVRGMEANTAFELTRSPSSGFIRQGRLDAGGIPDLREDEGNPLRVCRFIVPNTTTPPVQLELVTSAVVNELESLEFFVRSRATVPGAYQMQMEFFNYVTNQFENVRTVGLGTTYSRHGFREDTNPDKYVSAAREMRVKLLVKPSGPIANISWCIEFDEAVWRYAPFIV